MRVAVVVNPLAGGHPGRFDRERVERLVARAAAEAGARAEVIVTSGPGGGRDAARRALDEGARRVVAWGGDGTVNEVASVLVGTDVALAIVPTGSGNGLARELGVPSGRARALGLVFAGATRTIDAGHLGGRVFVNVAGVGFDAVVAARFNALGARRGFARYVGIVHRELATHAPRRYRIAWPGGGFDGAAGLVAIANSRQYGNGARIAPRAKIDDGWLDLVIVEATSPIGDIWRARRLFTGSMLRDPHVRWARVREVEIAAEGHLLCHVDGEPAEGPPTLSAAVMRRALHVCTSEETR